MLYTRKPKPKGDTVMSSEQAHVHITAIAALVTSGDSTPTVQVTVA
jgi:hypothetical protein